jgi:hypothetical protein
MVANWLYGVAHQTAVNAWSAARSRRLRRAGGNRPGRDLCGLPRQRPAVAPGRRIKGRRHAIDILDKVQAASGEWCPDAQPRDTSENQLGTPTQ